MNKKITLKTKDNIYTINIEPNSIVKNLNKIINTNNNAVFLMDRKVFYIFKKVKNYKKQKFAENKSSENTPETQELSNKSDEINIEDKKIVAEIKPISKKKTEDNLI